MNDCEGAVIPVTNDWITVREGEVDLVPAETKQQLVPVNNTIKFIQLVSLMSYSAFQAFFSKKFLADGQRLPKNCRCDQ